MRAAVSAALSASALFSDRICILCFWGQLAILCEDVSGDGQLVLPSLEPLGNALSWRLHEQAALGGGGLRTCRSHNGTGCRTGSGPRRGAGSAAAAAAKVAVTPCSPARPPSCRELLAASSATCAASTWRSGGLARCPRSLWARHGWRCAALRCAAGSAVPAAAPSGWGGAVLPSAGCC